MLNLRDYQSATLDALRNGFVDGHHAQILYAPTGAGKTEMAIALLNATRIKGNRAAMILDRVILCDQTSQRLEKYGIEHGVLQAGHWRHRPWEQLQVCSAQTLERVGARCVHCGEEGRWCAADPRASSFRHTCAGVQPIKGQRQDGACQRGCRFVQFR